MKDLSLNNESIHYAKIVNTLNEIMISWKYVLR